MYIYIYKYLRGDESYYKECIEIISVKLIFKIKLVATNEE